MESHRAQLSLCHEKIAGEVRVHEGRHEELTQWCDLPAEQWCVDDELYVCTTHAQSRHDGHRLQSRVDEISEGFRSERRSGDERRQG